MRFLSWLFSSPHERPNHLLGEQEFFRTLRIERMRSDRSGLPFCLLRFKLLEQSENQSGLHRLAEILRNRLRLTDILGHIGDYKVGVILTDTAEAGGHQVLEHLNKLLCDTGLHCALSLDLYDPKAIPNDPQGPSDASTPTSSNLPAPPSDKTPEPAIAFLNSRRPLRHLVLCESLHRTNVKRLFDFIVALVVLFLAMPLMILVAILIRLTSPGPVIFRQLREGQGGKPFTILKFRTMVNGAEMLQSKLQKLSQRSGPAFKIPNDPRVTVVGRFLRATCIDELPQLWNVLRGEMSLVGPRPLPVQESRQCQPWQRRRLDVLPGLTGGWQVGSRKVSFDDWMRSDIRYADEFSLRRDVAIMVQSIRVITLGKGNR